MADKEVKAAIDRRNEQRARGLLNYFREGLALDGATEGKALGDALDWAATDMRETAELYTRAAMRGGKSLADTLKAQAAGFALMAAGLRKLPAQRAEVPPSGQLPPRPNVQTDQPDVSGLKAFVAERVAVERTGRTECPECGEVPTGTDVERACEAFDEVSGTWVKFPDRHHFTPCGHTIPKGATASEIAEYLRGGIEQQQEALGEQQEDGSLLVKAADMPEFMDPSPAPWASGPDGERAEDPTPTVLDLGVVRMVEASPGVAVNAEPLSLTVPAGPAVIGLQFEDPAPPSWKRDPGGARVSFADLRALLGKDFEATGLPEHVSHSQIEGFGGGCGTQALLQRSETLGVVQVPQWANVGGTAYHYAVEEIEKLLRGTDGDAALSGIKASGGVRKVWERAFRRSMQETADASPVPIERWRASSKGLENQTWWAVEGETMLGRYVIERINELPRGWRRLEAVELGFLIDVEGVPFKGFIDQVWAVLQDEGPMRAGDVLIDDLKSGRMAPSRQQLGRYAQALLRQWQADKPISSRIWGRFWDARKGAWSDPIDLLADYSEDALALDVLGTDSLKRSGAFLPRETTFCGGCSVKHACPIFAARGA